MKRKEISQKFFEKKWSFRVGEGKWILALITNNRQPKMPGQNPFTLSYILKLEEPKKFERIVCALIFTLIFAALSPAQDEEVFTIARVKYGGGGDWYVGQTQLPNLLKGLRERTNVETTDKQEIIQLTDKKLYSYPFIYMTGHGNVSFTAEEVKALRLYLTRGGFLWANDDYGMDESFRREMKRVFPNKDLIEVPFDHELYHCYYDFPNGLPKIHEHDNKPPRGYGIFHEGRMVVFYDYESDIGDGLENPDVHNDPPEKREQALRMAINIVIYALTH